MNDSLNLVVVYGSESTALRNTIDWLLENKCCLIRIFKSKTPKPHPLCIDIQGIDELQNAIERANHLVDGPLRIGLIGCAFVRQNSLMLQMSDKEITDAIDTNILSYLRITQILLTTMIKNKFGRIVFLSSFRAEHPNPGAVLYGASKSFVESFYTGIGREYGRFNISTVSIRMGYFDSGMLTEYSEEQIKKSRKSIASGRFGNGEDLLSAIKFSLLTEYTNSGIIELNGGLIRE